MRIDPAALIIDCEDGGYCGAKPYGGDREHERAEHHNWEMWELDDEVLYCVFCGASAYLRDAACAGSA